MPSLRLNLLNAGLARSAALFLPAARLSSGGYSADEVDRSAGYVAIAHAEVQHFIDDRVRDLAIKAQQSFIGKGLMSQEIFAAVSYCAKPLEQVSNHDSANRQEEKVPQPAISAGPHYFSRVLSSHALSALRFYEDEIRTKNNGIKTANLLRLLLPLGIGSDKLHAKWLGKMDELGERRGRQVHKSLGSTIIGDPFEFADDIDLALHGNVAWAATCDEIASLDKFDEVIDARILAL